MEVYARSLATALAEAGHSVRVVARFAHARPETMRGLHGGAERPRRVRAGAVETVTVAPSRLRLPLLAPLHRLHFRAPRLAVGLMRAALGPSLGRALDGVDVVHYSGTGRELLGFVAAAEAARRGVPLVVTPHTHEGVWGDSPLDAALYRRADRVVALTNDEAGRLEALGVAPAALATVGHGVCVRGDGDGARFRERHGLGAAPVVLFLGRQTADKGLPALLDAMPSLWADVPEARVVVAGPPAEPMPWPSDARLCRLGRLSEAEREDALAAATVLCLPSEGEAFGLVVLEAWAYGVPVVVSDLPTLRERVEHVGGGLVTPTTPDTLARALARVLGDPRLGAALGTKGRGHAAGCTWARTASRTAAVYRAAIRDRASAAPLGGDERGL